MSRRLRIEAVRGKAAVCIGVRRGGKSTYLFQIIQRLLDDGVSRQNILYLNFFDDRLHNLRQDNLGLIAEAYYSIYPEKKKHRDSLLLLRRNSSRRGLGAFRRPPDAYGKNVRSISRAHRPGCCRRRSRHRCADGRFRGRCFPFSFREFLDYKGIESHGALSTKKQLLVRKAFEEYWETGGFPRDRRTWPEPADQDPTRNTFTPSFFGIWSSVNDISHPKAVIDSGALAGG